MAFANFSIVIPRDQAGYPVCRVPIFIMTAAITGSSAFADDDSNETERNRRGHPEST